MNWTEGELRLALALYCQLPFGRRHSRNPATIALAGRIGRSPSAVAMKLVNFSSIDPEILGSGRKGLGNASALDRKIWAEFKRDWERSIVLATQELGVVVESVSDYGPIDAVAVGTTRTAQVEVRTKQQLFRRMVLGSYAGTCCVSGLSEPKLLVASHIVPWNRSEKDRLDPRNGLCRSSLHDRAFDCGLMTVLPDGHIRISARILERRGDDFLQRTLAACEGKTIQLPEKFPPAADFLLWHNTEVFMA